MRYLNALLLSGVLLTGCVTAPGVPPTNGGQALLAGADPQLAAAVRTQPNEPEPWYQLGNSYAKQNQPAQAEQAYREALKRGPHPEARFNLGLMQVWQGVRSMREASDQLPAGSPARALPGRLLELLDQAGF